MLGELRAQEMALRARAHRLDAEAVGKETLVFASSGVDPVSPLALREVALFDSRHNTLSDCESLACGKHLQYEFDMPVN